MSRPRKLTRERISKVCLGPSKRSRGKLAGQFVHCARCFELVPIGYPCGCLDGRPKPYRKVQQ